MTPRPFPVPLNTITKYGTIIAVGITGGERYYWCEDRGVIAMMPWFVIEESEEQRIARRLKKKLAKKAAKCRGLRKRVAALEAKCRTARLLFVGT